MRAGLSSRAVHRVCHELWKPITAIQAFGELLEDQISGPLGEAQTAEVEAILSGAHEMTHLLENLIDMASVENDELRLEYADLDLIELCNTLRERFHGEARERGMRLEWMLPQDEMVIHGDALLLARSLGHVLENAVKFTPDGGTIELHLEREQGFYKFEVKDDGPGIDLEALDHIFEPYLRMNAGTAPGSASGMGVGLSIAQAVFEAHGGSITAENREHCGALFRVFLPAVSELAPCSQQSEHEQSAC